MAALEPRLENPSPMTRKPLGSYLFTPPPTSLAYGQVRRWDVTIPAAGHTFTAYMLVLGRDPSTHLWRVLRLNGDSTAGVIIGLRTESIVDWPMVEQL